MFQRFMGPFLPLQMAFWPFWHHFYFNWIFQATFWYVNLPNRSKTDQVRAFLVILQLLHLPLPKGEGNAAEGGDFASYLKGSCYCEIMWWISWWTNKTDFFWSYESDSLSIWWKTRTTKNRKLVIESNVLEMTYFF